MLFNSIDFLVFLPIVFAGYFLLPFRFRWLWLLLAGYVFYGWWRWEYLGILMFTTLLDFFCARKVAAHDDNQKLRKRWMLLSLVTNLGVLFVFKYFNFFLGDIERVKNFLDGHRLAKEMLVTLPVGISFYTFQSISYILDVYHRRTAPESKLGRYAVFVAYFPQLVAGPIERFQHLNTQLKQDHPLLYENLANGFRLMLYGFFVKMVVADNLAWYVDKIYENPLRWNSISILLGCVFFSFQIYADFYGYSLIAQGTARLFGVHLMDNFRTPYRSRSVAEFWQRWHISLTSWFRDYLYIPLGGNRVKAIRWGFNIMIVFLLSGLWHGANYTFIIWGGIHGLVYLLEHMAGERFRLSERFRTLGLVKTYSVVLLAWIFFRATDIDNVKAVFKGIVNPSTEAKFLPADPKVILLLVLFLLLDRVLLKARFDAFCEKYHVVQRWALYAFMIFSIAALAGTTTHPFIYFRF